MLGGSGNDTFFGDAGNDFLKGESGSDRLWGGAGNDNYYFNGSGVDVVNDGVTNTGSVRTGTAYDTVDRLFVSFTAADWAWEKKGNDLWVVSRADFAADGDFDNYVIVDDFFLGGHHTIEKLHTSDNVVFDLLTIL